MNNSSSVRKSAVATALVVEFGAVANAGNFSIIEPDSINLNNIPVNACVITTPGQSGLTAFDKIKKIMDARGQFIAASGDQVVVNGVRQEKIFTISKNLTGKEGFIIDSETSKGNIKSSPSLCYYKTDTAIIKDVSILTEVPETLKRGELGVALVNQHAKGSKVAWFASASNGSRFVVHFNQDSARKEAVLKGSDAQNMNAANFAFLENFDYSPQMKQLLEIQKEATKWRQ